MKCDFSEYINRNSILKLKYCGTVAINIHNLSPYVVEVYSDGCRLGLTIRKEGYNVCGCAEIDLAKYLKGSNALNIYLDESRLPIMRRTDSIFGGNRYYVDFEFKQSNVCIIQDQYVRGVGSEDDKQFYNEKDWVGEDKFKIE